MDSVKKLRKSQRAQFTRAFNAFNEKIDNDAPREEKMIAYQLLETRMMELDITQEHYNKLLCESEASEQDIEQQMATDDAYKTNFLTAKMKISALANTSGHAPNSNPNSAQSATRSNLAKLNMPKFQGSVREWLPFWSQFKRVHEDPSISREEKFQRLIDATIQGTRANDIVRSYPPTGENYDKVVKSLKSRFGREDLLVECYVRELLGLVLQNTVKGGKKVNSLSTLYDNLETYINALESLGVTTDKCAAMLYPLVESALPEDTLRVWQRSVAQRATADEEQNNTKDRLKRLILFLQNEVEGEERIELALNGFGIPDQESKKKIPSPMGENAERSTDTYNIPSCSALVNASEKKSVCIFCEANHESRVCDHAKKLSFDERKNIVKRSGACFKCLLRGHTSKDCKVKLTCEWCHKRHAMLMCSVTHGNATAGATTNRKKEKDKKINTPSVENSLVTFSDMPSVCLLTLRVELFTEDKTMIVHALYDPGSHQSYVRFEIAEKIGYQSLSKYETSHSLFGGVQAKSELYDVYRVRVRNLTNSYLCNFLALDQKVICDFVAIIEKSDWVERVKNKYGVTLSDVDSTSESIDLMIGADEQESLSRVKR
uniref:CCHC-type domain-containing protein n=1 Tax=Trichogramma kaykai TaxID=54128 RepID=A0ABD2WZE2_9HYME